jgi:hypothetical protein
MLSVLEGFIAASARTSLALACNVAVSRFSLATWQGNPSLVPNCIHHPTPRGGGVEETKQLTI